MIRLAILKDINQIWKLRCMTSDLLHERGIDQWQSQFPTKEQFINDINTEEFYVMEVDHKIIGMMALKSGVEPTYDVIYDGNWHENLPYMTIHRIAVDRAYKSHGYGLKLLDFAKKKASTLGYHYMRIDTHEDNQAAIRRFTQFGFVYCGYILLSEDHPTTRKRLAYDMTWEIKHENSN